MSNVASYRECAAQCLDLSKKTSNRADHDLLVTMAQRWLELAERARHFEWPDPDADEKRARRDH